MRAFANALLISLLLAFLSCGGDNSLDAESSYRTYWDMILSGNDKVYDDCFCHSGEELMQNEKEIARLSYGAYLKRLDRMDGGLSSMTVIGSSLSENGDKTVLRIRLSFNDGKEEETEVSMWMCSGRWKINLDF